MSENYFQQLNDVNVQDHVEKKNGLSYLSWAWAWQELKKRFPDATYTIYETPEGINYFTDGKTCWVKTGVTVNGIEHIEYLPVMDHRNKSIPLSDVTSFDVNKSIQRSLTKAVARHGLGLYIYAGEDLPESEQCDRLKEQAERTEKTAFKGNIPICPVCGGAVLPVKLDDGKTVLPDAVFKRFGKCYACYCKEKSNE